MRATKQPHAKQHAADRGIPGPKDGRRHFARSLACADAITAIFLFLATWPLPLGRVACTCLPLLGISDATIGCTRCFFRPRTISRTAIHIHIRRCCCQASEYLTSASLVILNMTQMVIINGGLLAGSLLCAQYVEDGKFQVSWTRFQGVLLLLACMFHSVLALSSGRRVPRSSEKY